MIPTSRSTIRHRRWTPWTNCSASTTWPTTPPSTLVRAQGDLALIQGIGELSLGPLSPEQSLYAGAAILFGIEQLVLVNGHPELLSQSQLLAAASTSVHDIQYGLSHLEPADAAGLRGWLAEIGSAGPADLLTIG